MIAYSLDGRTIPSGKSRILRMPAGVTLVGASFSDAKANSLRSGGDAIVTSNAPIEAISQLAAVSNYPNPFRGHDLPLSVDGGGRIRDDPRILCEWRFGRGIERSARRGGR